MFMKDKFLKIEVKYFKEYFFVFDGLYSLQ